MELKYYNVRSSYYKNSSTLQAFKSVYNHSFMISPNVLNGRWWSYWINKICQSYYLYFPRMKSNFLKVKLSNWKLVPYATGGDEMSTYFYLFNYAIWPLRLKSDEMVNQYHLVTKLHMITFQRLTTRNLHWWLNT